MKVQESLKFVRLGTTLNFWSFLSLTDFTFLVVIIFRTEDVKLFHYCSKISILTYSLCYSPWLTKTVVNGQTTRTFYIVSCFTILQEWDHAAILSCLLATEKYKLPSTVESEDVANVSQIFCRIWIILFSAETLHHGDLMNLECLHHYPTLKRDKGSFVALLGKWKHLRFKKCSINSLRRNFLLKSRN